MLGEYVGFSRRDPLGALRVYARGYSKISGRANPDGRSKSRVTGRMGAPPGLAVEWI